jgi:NAD(P)H dehydrogenase (quinone)
MKALIVYAHFHPAQDYGPNERLKPGVIAQSGVQWNV